MTRASRFLAIFVLGLLAAIAGTHAQANDQAGVMLQTAIHTEMVDGDLRKAIELYKEIVARFGDERPVAAKALWGLPKSHPYCSPRLNMCARRPLVQSSHPHGRKGVG